MIAMKSVAAAAGSIVERVQLGRIGLFKLVFFKRLSGHHLKSLIKFF